MREAATNKTAFKAFLGKYKSDIEDCHIVIRSVEAVFTSDQCHKKIMIDIYRNSRKTDKGKSKGWKDKVVYELNKCGFKYHSVTSGGGGNYQQTIACKFTF